MRRNPRSDKEAELRSQNQAVGQWQDVFRHGAWQDLVRFLETEYVQALSRKPQSVAELRERQGRADMIRDIFTFIAHDFNLQQALVNDLATLRADDEMLPDKEVYF
jgi:hypothetical protein